MSKRIRHSHQTSPLRKPLMLLAALLGLALPSVGYSLVFTVNISTDALNTSTCGSTSNSQCTLRAAIQLANITPGKDVINLTSDVSLNIPGTFENASKSGDLDISDDLEIIGSGAITPTINANGPIGLKDRVFHIQSGAKVTLRNITITGGFLDITSTTKCTEDILCGGGGILVQGSSTLNLKEVNLTYNELTSLNGSFLITGGGLFVDALSNAYIENSQITNNRGLGGGGIANLGRTEIRNTDILSNVGGKSDGGAIRNMGGFLNIGNSTIDSNTTTRTGGGIHNQGQGQNTGNVIVNNSVIKNNRATFFGGGISNLGPFTLTNSTINDNESVGRGGGIYNTALGNMDIINSTISGNEVLATNDGLSSDGGGIFNTRVITLTNVTLFDNRANSSNGVGGNQLTVFGGDTGSSAGVTVANTIIADGNRSNPGTTVCSGLTFPINYKTLIDSSGGNLESGGNLKSSNSCGLITSGTSRTPDIINISPSNLGLDTALTVDPDSPGTTPVHKLLSTSSAAYNSANSSICPHVDQRFLQRTDGRCDIGAYEFGAKISLIKDYVDLKLVMSDNADPIKPNDALSPLTYKVVLTNVYVNASATVVVLEIKLPSQFSFTKIDTTSTTSQPDCDPTPDGLGIIECRMVTLPGLARVEVFITGNVVGSFDKPTTITAEAGVKSSTQDAFLSNNRVTEDTVVDKNADTTLNFNSTGNSSGGGGGALHLPWLLTLGTLLLARRQRRA